MILTPLYENVAVFRDVEENDWRSQNQVLFEYTNAFTFIINIFNVILVLFL